MGSTGPATPTPEEVLQEVAKSGTNVDTIVGRLVIDQGLRRRRKCSTAVAGEAVDGRPEGAVAGGPAGAERVRDASADGACVRWREAEQSRQEDPQVQGAGEVGRRGDGDGVQGEAVEPGPDRGDQGAPAEFTSNPPVHRAVLRGGSCGGAVEPPEHRCRRTTWGRRGSLLRDGVRGQDDVYDEIAKHKRFREKDAIDLTLQVAEALQHARAWADPPGREAETSC